MATAKNVSLIFQYSSYHFSQSLNQQYLTVLIVSEKKNTIRYSRYFSQAKKNVFLIIHTLILLFNLSDPLFSLSVLLFTHFFNKSVVVNLQQDATENCRILDKDHSFCIPLK